MVIDVVNCLISAAFPSYNPCNIASKKYKNDRAHSLAFSYQVCKMSVSYLLSLSHSGYEYTFFATGDYTFSCGGKEERGNFTVVSSQYTITLCKDCADKTERFYVSVGDNVQWVVVPDQEDSDPSFSLGCAMSLTQAETGQELTRFPLGKLMIDHRVSGSGLTGPVS